MKELRKNKKTFRAFSLIEVMFYIAMLSVFILVISTFWGTLIEVQERGKAMNAVDSEAQFIMTKITQVIRNANNIASPTAGNSASALTLAHTETAKNPTVINLNSSYIRLSEGVTPFVNLNSNVVNITSLTFSNLSRSSSAGVIKIQLTLSYVNPDGVSNLNYSQTYYATASLR